MTIQLSSIETMGALDGPGMRTILFLQGCPLRCAYCHNADTFSPSGGEMKSVEYLVDFCLRYKNFWGDGGGVTLSGGEPLMQKNGVLELTKQLQKNGVHVCLDTSGAPYREEILDLVDMVLLDVKHTDKDEYQKLTQYPMDDMLKSLEFLQKNKKRFWVRQVIVPGITDSVEQVKKLKKMSAGAEKIELLEYHEMGVEKWAKQGLEYKLKGVKPPSLEVIEKLRKIVQ
ncbi:MAG: pyruvate formate-lyase-activating protein [Firmicutes bacterium]|nr:pyruvate formate-lyase-activating protein [Bacillota bacterium]